MCGFLSWFKPSPRPWAEGELDHACDSLASLHHRGPDDGHQVQGDGWWMGFRRLSILDLSPAGRQPMSFGNGRYTLVFNGEIYNFRELKASLPAREWRSTGDSEVLGAMLETQTPGEVLAQLRGMFAFAWWDNEERSLVVARDHFGIKPLYYSLSDTGDLVAGSELRAVLRLSGKPLALSQRALAQYFRWGAVQAPDTIIDGIECLPSGHLLHYKEGVCRVERYFRPDWNAAKDWTTSHRDQLADTRSTILGSVEAHLVSDVPVGVFLSGGLDSTLMTACMKHLGQADIQAFSIGYEENSGVPDETDAAERTAAHYGCRFVRERVSSESLYGRLDAYLESLDQPTGDALNTYLASQLAAQHVKVTLSGLGADEWFAGYNYHRLALLARLSPLNRVALGRVTGAGARLMESLLPASLRGHKAWKAFSYAVGGAGQTAAEIHTLGRTILTAPRVARLLGILPAEAHRMTEDNALRMSLVGALGERAPDSWLHQLLALETETYLPNTLLRDNDCTSMAHSLELRVPLVDREVFALAGRLPPDAKLGMRAGKKIIREAFKELLPPWINDDKQKKTFTLPLMKWMRTPKWRERIMDTLSSKQSGALQFGEAERLAEAYFADSTNTKATWHLSQPVWMMFVLEQWFHKMKR